MRNNVLLIMSDQHRMDAAGCYGHPIVQTPNLDRLASEGIRFTQTYCQSPLCVTSRGSMLTGQFPHTCRAYTHRDAPLPDGTPTLGSLFREAGYATGAIGKLHVHGETRTRDLGFDDRQMRLYTYQFEDYIAAVGEAAVDAYATYRKPLARYQTTYNPTNSGISIPEPKMYDALVVDRCVAFLEQHRDAPFFLWAGIEKPHPDWTVPEAYHRRYDPDRIPLPETVFETRRDMPEAWYRSTRQAWCFDIPEIHRCMAAYYANVTYMDHKVGVLLEALDRLGLRENTLVIYTSDHGEMLFDHGMVQKHNFFESAVRVPLLMRQPGTVPSQGTRDQVTGLTDLLPTLCELNAIATPDSAEGHSLASTLGDNAADTDHPVFSEFYDYGLCERMIRQGDWKYMVAEGDQSQLYHLGSDPAETVNRIDDPALTVVRERLHAAVMDGWERPDLNAIRCQGPWNDRDWLLEADNVERERHPSA